MFGVTQAGLNRREFLAAGGAAALAALLPGRADAASFAFKQAVAESAQGDPALLRFYSERDFAGIWTGGADRRRRQALLEAFLAAPDHALPAAERYDIANLRRRLSQARTQRQLGELEVSLSRDFLRFVDDIQSGILEPNRLGDDMGLKAPRRDHYKTLVAFSKSTPAAFIRRLPPQSPKYARLLKEKATLEAVIARGGWGPQVRARKIKPGDTGPEVIALRDRLVRMGYLRPTVSAEYDAAMQRAVQAFQHAHGLFIDSVVGKSTLKALNTEPEERLLQVLVGLERQRWMNKPLGKRHIYVNQADFKAWIYDDGKPTFETRVVIGQVRKDLQTAEFSDEMTHMIVNPSWHVPESIMVKEYLPKLRNNPGALNREGIILSSARGVVNPANIDFSQYGPGNWPFSMRQPPGPGNALGRVKFLFPNKYNIYMHDTPAKSLFGREKRAYSHGCVRVQRPFEFAYALLAPQVSDPKGYFQSILATGEETQVDIVPPVPVHITYQTAWVDDDGIVNFRDDFYGRDRRVWQALQAAGVRAAVATG